jgi:anti-sigma regulatory factor (Ser/Thr protein kinase)
VLKAVADACGNQLPTDLAPSEQVVRREKIAPATWTELLLGERRLVGAKTHEPGQAVFSGAFNPLHAGHRRMVELAAKPPKKIDAAPLPYSIKHADVKLEVKNEVAELKSVMATLAQFFDAHRVPHRAAYAANLAVDELVVNVIRYAYVDDDPHVIDLDLAIRGQQIILRIVDDGRPFDPRTGPALDLNAEERQAGGMGLLLVLDMVDVLTYQRVDERNWVEVRVRLSGDKYSDQ